MRIHTEAIVERDTKIMRLNEREGEQRGDVAIET
jgi:hypothetical protein